MLLAIVHLYVSFVITGSDSLQGTAARMIIWYQVYSDRPARPGYFSSALGRVCLTISLCGRHGCVSLPDNGEDYWGVHVNKETRDFIHGVENKRIPPGDDSASQWTLS